MAEETRLTVSQERQMTISNQEENAFFEGVKAIMPRYHFNKDNGAILDQNNEERRDTKVILFPFKIVSRVLFNEPIGTDPIWLCRCPRVGEKQVFEENIKDKTKLDMLKNCTKCPETLVSSFGRDYSNHEAKENGLCEYAFWGEDGQKPACKEVHNMLFWDVEKDGPFVLGFSRTAVTPLLQFLSLNFRARGNKGDKVKRINTMARYLILSSKFFDKGKTLKWNIPYLKMTGEIIDKETFEEMLLQADSMRDVFYQFLANESQQNLVEDEETQGYHEDEGDNVFDDYDK